MYKNQEGYPPPTAGEPRANNRGVDRQREGHRLAAIGGIMPIIRQAATTAGFEIVGRITFRDKATGKEYR